MGPRVSPQTIAPRKGFHNDSNPDLADRERGISTMSREYIDKVNNRRVALGFPHCEDGLFDGGETYTWLKHDSPQTESRA
jgi:hypothetical protein|tara:strand:+ start:848 stop:1087 length:240 start_codon:yes stop_codon:yes gene_type:complete